VRSVDAIESCRPVRALLIKGAKTGIADKRGKIPRDYIRDIQNEDLGRELIELLSP
jgi:hypothetical protein